MTPRIERRSITVAAYRDSNGEPCCAKDFSTGEVCVFYTTQRFGSNETCLFAPVDGRYSERLERRKGGAGSLIPCSACPIWNTTNNEEDKCTPP